MSQDTKKSSPRAPTILDREQHDKLWAEYFAPDTNALKKDWIKERMISAHTKLAHGIAGRYSKDPDMIDELYSIGLITMFEKFDRFEPQRGFLFATYITHQIRGKISDHFKKQKAKKAGFGNVFISLSREDGSSIENVFEDRSIPRPDLAIMELEQSDPAVRSDFFRQFRFYMKRIEKRRNGGKPASETQLNAITYKINILKARLGLDDAPSFEQLGKKHGVSLQSIEQHEKAMLEELKRFAPDFFRARGWSDHDMGLVEKPQEQQHPDAA